MGAVVVMQSSRVFCGEEPVLSLPKEPRMETGTTSGLNRTVRLSQGTQRAASPCRIIFWL